jgi:hypothetical protein
MKTNLMKKQVSLKVYIVTVLAMLIVSLASIGFVRSTSYPGDNLTNKWMTAPTSESSYDFGPYNSTFFYGKNQTGYGTSATLGYEYLGTNGTDIAQACVNNTSANGGGQIFVEPGSYSITITAKNNTSVIVSSGATGVTVNADATATCTIVANGRTRYYSAGILVFDMDMSASSLSSFSWMNSTSISTNYAFWGNTNITDILANPRGTATYSLWTSGGVTYAKSGSTGQIATSGAVDTVLQYAENQLTSGGNIYLDHTITAAVLIVNQSNIAIWSDTMLGSDSWQGPSITNVTIQAIGVDIKNLALLGFNMRELNFYHSGGNIVFNVVVQSCQIRPSAGSGNGIRFLGDGGVGYTELVRFLGDSIYDWYDQSTSSRWEAAITISDTSTGGNGYVWFEDLFYKPKVGNARMLAVVDGGRFDKPTFFSNLQYVENGYANLSVINLKNGKLNDIIMTGSTIESWDSMTFLQIDQLGNTHNCRLSFNDNNIKLLGNSSAVLTFISNAAVSGNWSIASGLNGVFGGYNRFMGVAAGQTFAVGTTGICANFIFNLDYIYTSGTTVSPYQNKQILMGGVTGNLATDGSLQYIPVNAKAAAGGSTTDRALIVNFPCILRYARVYIDAAPGATAFRNFTLFKNGVATALSMNVTGASANSFTEITTEVVCAAGDRIVWQAGGGGTPTASMATIDIEMLWYEYPV